MIKEGDTVRHRLSDQVCTIKRVLVEVEVEGLRGLYTYEAKNVVPVRRKKVTHAHR